jgi:hypothetical protein
MLPALNSEQDKFVLACSRELVNAIGWRMGRAVLS